MAAAVSPGSIRTAGGRPKGSRNKRTTELVQRAEAKGITPLDLMLEVMHDLWQEGDRLTAVEQKVETDVRQTVINGEPLTIEEFDRLYGVKGDEEHQPA